MNRHITISDFFASFLITIIIFCFAVTITINFRPLYYWDIQYLKIIQHSGFTMEQISENYNALIRYCSPFYHKALVFPSMKQSATATIHFSEVKKIFNLLFYLGLICLLFIIMIIPNKIKHKNYRFLSLAAIFTLLLPIFFLIASVINFDQTFTFIHKIIFQNNYWIFNPKTDPIIKILPQQFFLHCGILIAIIHISGSIFLFNIYQQKKKNSILETIPAPCYNKK